MPVQTLYTYILFELLIDVYTPTGSTSLGRAESLYCKRQQVFYMVSIFPHVQHSHYTPKTDKQIHGYIKRRVRSCLASNTYLGHVACQCTALHTQLLMSEDIYNKIR